MRPLQSDSVPELSRIVLTEEEIQREIDRLGKDITRDYGNKDPVVVGVLKGAFVFTCDLIRRIETLVTLDFLSLRSFSLQHRDARRVEITRDLEESIEGREVLIIEDLVDTGLSLNYLCHMLGKRQPASVVVCSLLDRPQLRLVDLPLRYRGFEVDDQFLVGYGLDFQGRFLNLPYIAALKERPEAFRVA